jgi:heat-inducible transcriptional repressor
MAEELLSEREQLVLESVVRNYIITGSPTGSRFLSKQPGFNFSAATIRNIMADLEERGYISQPHTSAGRIPTDKGYRYYVDKLMKTVELPQNVREQIKEYIIKSEPTDLHLLMEATSKALSRATNQLGVILAPKLNKGIFRNVYIHQLDSKRVLINLTIDSGFVKTLVIELKTEISSDRLNRACQVINQKFYGLTLEEMSKQEQDLYKNIEEYDLGIVRIFVPSIKKMIETHQEEEIVTQGETNIVIQPEFFSKEQVSAIIEVLEEKKMLMHIFAKDTLNKEGVIISIGQENNENQLQSFSIVKTKYQIGHLEGALGVVGPKRMHYPLLVSAVDYTAKLLKEIYS